MCHSPQEPCMMDLTMWGLRWSTPAIINNLNFPSHVIKSSRSGIGLARLSAQVLVVDFILEILEWNISRVTRIWHNLSKIYFLDFAENAQSSTPATQLVVIDKDKNGPQKNNGLTRMNLVVIIIVVISAAGIGFLLLIQRFLKMILIISLSKTFTATIFTYCSVCFAEPGRK